MGLAYPVAQKDPVLTRLQYLHHPGSKSFYVLPIEFSALVSDKLKALKCLSSYRIS